jgi:hypothetical protein
MPTTGAISYRVMVFRAGALVLSLLLISATPWRVTVDERLPLLGHRNWIVIADSAYPLQSGNGIETVISNESQIETLRHVLFVLSRAKHVRPVVYTDNELSFVPEQDAVGITAYRQLLSGLFEKQLPGQKINTIPHEEIIHKLDEAGKTFNVLIIKTNMTLPYTSVFLELRAAYWGDEEEQRLRQAIK